MSPRRTRVNWPSALAVSALSLMFGYVAAVAGVSYWALIPVCLLIGVVFGVWWPFLIFGDVEGPE